MQKKILTVGFSLGTDDAEYAAFDEKTSLLDWDIILFRPDISSFLTYAVNNSEFQGKLWLNNTKSFQLREACAHWRREIIQAVEAGKIVVVFLSKPEQVFVATGQTTTTGTGRNQKVTPHVELISNYAAIPINTGWTATQGSAIVLNSSAGSQFLASYWKKFGPQSRYSVVWNDDAQGVCLTTQHGQKPVGILKSVRSSAGALFLLPELDFSQEEFFSEDDDEDEIWSAAGKQFASSLVGEIVAISKAVTSGSERTVEPTWATSEIFALPAEISLRKKLLIAEAEVERAQAAKDEIVGQLNEAGQLRGLLFENGKALEASIISALHILGFSAAQYQDDKSEFDAVFECQEGRLLGEAEGKDNKAVNIEKLRQLSMNIHEDLQREEVQTAAKGILFGNGYRLTEPKDRPQQFTDKCINSAATMSIGLVRTDQLYSAARYLSAGYDEDYAHACRSAMINGVGLIDLPVRADDNNRQALADVVSTNVVPKLASS